MNCPVWDCDEVLILNGGQFIMHGKIYTHGRCPIHGLIKMRLMGKQIKKLEIRREKSMPDKTIKAKTFDKWWESIINEFEKNMIHPSPFQIYLHKMIASAAWSAAIGSKGLTEKSAFDLLSHLVDKKIYSGNAMEWYHDCKDEIADVLNPRKPLRTKRGEA